MLDTRREIRRLIGCLEFNSQRALKKMIICFIVALLITFLPNYNGLNPAAQWTLFILIFAAGLWVTEAIPAFAVALLVIALEIAILGRVNGVFATSDTDWEMFIRPWSSPLIWLFFGGFILAAAASKTRLDRWLVRNVLARFGTNPAFVLFGLMLMTFTFSMFMSNTATTVMMLAVITPVIANLDKDDPVIKAIMIGIPFAANLGGMGTIIGSPPNAIAAGAIADIYPINFAEWMLAGLPPAILLGAITWIYLLKRYPSKKRKIDLSELLDNSYKSAVLPLWKKLLVMIVFIMTICLWLTTPLHGISTSVISFIPITAFAAVRVIGVNDIRKLPWDVLLLLTGGLSLGVAVSKTGLAEWMVGELQLSIGMVIVMAFVFSYFATIISNFMSNTAAANIIVPIGLAAAVGFEPQVVIPIALGASAAMCMPISTPPNALAYASGKIDIKDFISGGLIIGILAPLISVLWCLFVFNTWL